uniref:Uncharacterized protein n=1 Tax=Poecilia mexicana TaxID=48701 RepID=A0A3B3Y5A0_9TELE
LHIVLDDHVRDGIEHKLDVAGVGGTGEVRIDLLGLLVAVEVLELPLHVDGRLFVGVLAFVVWEAHCQGNAFNLLSQQVLLVEEENERCVGEPVVVADGVEQTQALGHAALSTQLNTEYDCSHALKTVNPLLPLRTLSTHIHHLKSELLEGELVLHDACGHVAGAQDVLHSGDVLGLVLVGALKALLDPCVCPQTFHHPQKLWGDLPFALSRPREGKELNGVVGAIGIVKVNLKGGEGSDYAGERVDGVVEDERLVLLAGFQVEATTVNDFHLLNNGALSGVAGAQQEKLDLTALPLTL